MLASEADTTVSASGFQDFQLDYKGDSALMYVASDNFMTITADKPIMVVQFSQSMVSKSKTIDISKLSDASMF